MTFHQASAGLHDPCQASTFPSLPSVGSDRPPYVHRNLQPAELSKRSVALTPPCEPITESSFQEERLMSLMVSETPLIMAGKVQQSRAVLKSQRPGSRRDQHSQGITAGYSPQGHTTQGPESPRCFSGPIKLQSRSTDHTLRVCK